jgi:fatty-acyl-CoA synthase
MNDHDAALVRSARSQGVADLLRRTALRSPGKMAVRATGTAWTYREFYDLSVRVARGFADLGLEAGDRVAVLARNCPIFACLRYALAARGFVLVPINSMLGADEIAFVLRDCGARILCVDREFANVGKLAAAKAMRTLTFVWMNDEDPPFQDMKSFSTLANALPEPPPPLDARALLQIMYTSGTESLPKGVMLSHDAVISQYVSCLIDCEIAQSDVMLHAMPLFHCAQLDVFLGPSIYVGGENIITSDTRPDNLLRLLDTHRVSSFFAPPTIWISLLRSALFDRTDLSSLRKGYYGASVMPVAVLAEMQSRLPHTRLWNVYGQTEIAPLATVLKPEDQFRKAGSAGRPALNVETRVVNEEGLDVQVGEVGEIVHRSPQLLSGYFNNDDRTIEAFDGGWFHSGDLARIDSEGYLYVVDRKKDVIKTGGENVSSREVEEAIYGLAEVAEVAVVAVADPVWIEAVTAVVVVKDGAALSEHEVITHCRASLAGFKTPKRVLFVSSLPKSPSGKLLKRELREWLKGSPLP